MTKKIAVIITLLALLWLTGVAGYQLVEGWNFLDAVYMTAISLTTVGFKEVHPLTAKGKIFTVLLVTTGVGLFFYAVGSLAEGLIEGHLKGLISRRRMLKKISKLERHYIVCGYGRLGRVICNELQVRNRPLVVIDNSQTSVEQAEKNGLFWILGDATTDDVLLNAGIKKAKGLISVLNTDAANVYITISAKALNSGITIVTRAEDENAEKKMFQAGATKVISPYKIGASRMALAVLKPTLTEFLDLASHSVGFDLDIEQIEIKENSELDGKALKDINLRERTGVTVIAIKTRGGDMSLQLRPEKPLRAGDVIVALGGRAGIEKVLQMAGQNTVLEEI
ncbi:MAG: potassium channel protein [Thermodesulfatator sp.]|nr:MAG: potassium channel protein [Thermodesulfatator sp.]